ncbi:hypothetical protein EGM97_12015 [Pseudomonas sp. AF32]|nr:hypothetical protein [Pseudomonas sp. AF32]
MKSTRSTVGAGLLAKAVCQAALMSTDTSHSRASPLPQGDAVPSVTTSAPPQLSVVRLARTCAVRRRCIRRSGG